MQGPQQRSLVVECLTRIGNKYGGDAQRVVNDEHRTRGVPCRVAAGLEGVADSAVGEARRVRLLLHQQLAAELLYHTPLAVVLNKGIVLFGSSLRERLEPVGIVGDTHFKCPLLHARSHCIGY